METAITSMVQKNTTMEIGPTIKKVVMAFMPSLMAHTMVNGQEIDLGEEVTLN